MCLCVVQEDGDYRCGESEDEGGGARRASDDDRSSSSSGEGSEDEGDSELEEEGLVVDPEQGAIIPDTEAQPGEPPTPAANRARLLFISILFWGIP